MLNAESLQVSESSTYVRRDGVHPRVHAKSLDRSLGYKITKIEEKLVRKFRAYDTDGDSSSRKQHYQGTQTWIGLHPQALQTPYCDIYDALNSLINFEIERVIDIGAGYGRVGLVMNSLFPSARFTGYEILKQRQIEGNRVFTKQGIENCEILLQNVLDENFFLPKAQVYFIYDFSELEDLEKILDNLEKLGKNNCFFLIVKGDRIDYLMEKKYKCFLDCSKILNSGELKIYSSLKNLE